MSVLTLGFSRYRTTFTYYVYKMVSCIAASVFSYVDV